MSANMYIGIDLGTSAMKGIVVDRGGNVVKQTSVSYEVSCPKDGWTEQDPKIWVEALDNVLSCLLSGGIADEIKGISFSGQMHGLVAIDFQGKVIRPCILWNDARTEVQTAYLNEVVGKKALAEYTGNIAFAGFTAPKLLWLKENEPDNFGKINKIMLPKDYLAYVLTNVAATDFSDASGTLLLDVKNKKWSNEMLRICGLSIEQLPSLHESYECIGNITSDIALRYGMRGNVKVIIGAGDNASAAIGNGTVRDGDCNISLGTSGTIFVCRDSYVAQESNSLHNFVHANGKWHLMGCILSAASCRKWWIENILQLDDYDNDEFLASASDCTNLVFLPYLRGERSPHNDVQARGAFVGLSAETTRGQMSRAVMEGVAFAIRDCLEMTKQNGVSPRYATLCGGGAKSRVWRQILADVLAIPIRVPHAEQGPSYGATILAMVGCGEYANIEDATDHLAKPCEEVLPDVHRTAVYEKAYRRYTKLYPALKDLFS